MVSREGDTPGPPEAHSAALAPSHHTHTSVPARTHMPEELNGGFDDQICDVWPWRQDSDFNKWTSDNSFC